MVTRERRARPALADRVAAAPAPRRQRRQGRPPHRAPDQGLGSGVPRRPPVPAGLGVARPPQARRRARRAGPDQDVPGHRLPARRRAAGAAARRHAGAGRRTTLGADRLGRSCGLHVPVAHPALPACSRAADRPEPRAGRLRYARPMQRYDARTRPDRRRRPERLRRPGGQPVAWPAARIIPTINREIATAHGHGARSSSPPRTGTRRVDAALRQGRRHLAGPLRRRTRGAPSSIPTSMRRRTRRGSARAPTARTATPASRCATR